MDDTDDKPVSVECVFTQQPLQTSVFEGLVMISRGADCYNLIPNTCRDRQRLLQCIERLNHSEAAEVKTYRCCPDR